MKSKQTPTYLELPHYPNAFIGRSHHIQAIHHRLQEKGTRLITLLGPGGIGKTRLALKVAEEAQALFTDGVLFVPLDTVEEAELMGFYIAQQLGIKSQSKQEWLAEVIAHLRDKNLLLMLDNLEQIIDAALQIDQLIKHCPNIQVLVTSRIVLDLSYELEYPLDGLSRPNANLFPGPSDLVKFDAIQLFVQKAQTSKPSFKLSEDNAPSIVEICQKLDGLPLPIELAAARVKLFPPKTILLRLEQSLQLLKTKSRDVIPRHQTIRNTIQWSYDLLDPDEQQLFQQLSFFRSGFNLHTLSALYPDRDIVDLVESFISKSLIVQMEAAGEEARFRMLKLIRDYGLQLLAGQPQTKAFYRSYALFFAQLVQAGQNLAAGLSYQQWIEKLGVEYEDIMAALNWLSQHEPKVAIKTATILWRFHLHRGFLEEGLQMINAMLCLPIEQELDRANLLEGAGLLAQNRGNYQQAKDFFKEGLEYWKKSEHQGQIAKALNNLGWSEWRLGNYGHSRSYSENALDIAKSLEDRQGQAKSMNNLAWTYMNEGLYEIVEALQREILSIQRQEKAKRGIAFAQTNLGWALFRMGKMDEAVPLVDEAIALFDELEHQQLKSFARAIRAEGLYLMQEMPAASQLLQTQCIPQFIKIGDLWAVGFCSLLMGRIYFEQRNYRQAEEYWNQALATYRQTEDRYGKAGAYIHLSRLHWVLKQQQTASQELDQGIELAAALGALHLLKEGYEELAKRSDEQEDLAMCLQHLTVADHYAQSLGSYQYQIFRDQVKPLIRVVSSGLNSNLDQPTKGIGRHWQQADRFLAKPIKEQELLEGMAQLFGKAFQEAVSPAKPSDPIVEQVQALIENHLAEVDFSIADLCHEIGLSHSQLHRRLHAQTGQSISKFIRSIRLKRAKELLADPKIPIAAVAIDTGFKDPDYFYRVFKQTFHLTPGAFRRQSLQQK
ncbi:MAG: tetratricopeptide repeat protein [Saprospiraceae bacterium]|nr:tetratricopeptide repeat protein [Saprospiraceae bacterium]